MSFANIFYTSQSAEINKQNFSKTFNFESTNLLQLDINSFEIGLINNKNVENSINDVINCQIEGFYDYANRTMYPMAIRDYKDANANGYPFIEHQAVLVYELKYNQNCTLSYYYDEYVFTGGAHGTTQRRANTFSLKTGNKLMLNNFFTKPNSKELILQEILKQAEQNLQETPGIYFDNYEELIVKNFNKRNFYLSTNGVVFFYNQYEIAPYSTGIVEFEIPYSLVQMPPKC